MTTDKRREKANGRPGVHSTHNRPASRYLWLWTLTGVLTASAVAVAVKLAIPERQETIGVIQYAPLPAGETAKHLLPVSDLRGLAGVAKSPAVLRRAAEQAGMSTQALSELLEVRPTIGTQTITLTLRWPGEGDAASVLDSILTDVIRCNGDLRLRRIDDRAADMEKTIAANEEDAATGQKVLRDLARKAGTHDLAQEVKTAITTVETLAASLAQKRRDEATARLQFAEAHAMVENLARLPVPSKTTTASIGARASWLQFMIDQSRLNSGSDALLLAKKAELEALRSAFKVGAASRVDIIRLEGEVESLIAKAKDDANIQRMKTELNGMFESPVSPESVQAAAKKIDLRFQAAAALLEIPLLEGELALARQRLDKLLTSQAEAAPVVRRIERAEGERARLQAELDQLRSLRTVATAEAVLLHPATTTLRGFVLLRGWIGPVAAFAFVIFLWVTAWRSFHSTAKDPSPIDAEEIGLTVLANVQARRDGTSEDSDTGIRSLALSIRQRLPRAGSTVLFTPLHAGGETRAVLLRTAETLARRDERVLVLDAVRPDPTSLIPLSKSSPKPGLSNYLSFEVLNAFDLIESTRTGGVDLLSVGTAAMMPDDLATHRMRELMLTLRETYSVIIVNGPPLYSDTDVQTLSAYHDGTVILGQSNDLQSEEARRLLRDYRRLGIPLLGFVSLAG